MGSSIAAAGYVTGLIRDRHPALASSCCWQRLKSPSTETDCGWCATCTPTITMGSFYTSSTVAVHLVIDAMLSEIGKITRRTGLLHEQQTANVDVEDHTARREGIENNDIKSPYRSSHLRIVTIINNSSSIAVSKTHISYGSPESPMYVSACGRPWMSMPSTWEFRRRSFMNTM